MALTPLERRSLIPMSLRKKLCERSGGDSICNFSESSHNSVDDDENYSKWSICKHHPELLLCRWDPASKAVIPEVQPELVLTTPSWNSVEASFDEETDSGISGLSLVPAIFESSIFLDTTPAVVQPQHNEEVRLPEKAAPSTPSTNQKETSVKEDRPRYDGKLSDERKIPSQPANSDESPDEDGFGEDIMMVKEGVFG
ncbi:hypothetical protein Aduo_014309 [Ancylostoma duodenale]